MNQHIFSTRFRGNVSVYSAKRSRMVASGDPLWSFRRAIACRWIRSPRGCTPEETFVSKKPSDFNRNPTEEWSEKTFSKVFQKHLLCENTLLETHSEWPPAELYFGNALHNWFHENHIFLCSAPREITMEIELSWRPL